MLKYTTKQTENGQRAKYGDSYYTFIIDFENSEDATEENTFDIGQILYPCTLSAKQHRAEDNSMDNHFRNSYQITKLNDISYKYMVIYQSTH